MVLSWTGAPRRNGNVAASYPCDRAKPEGYRGAAHHEVTQDQN
jgi:hypothetical protein